ADGKKVWDGLIAKYQNSSKQRRRILMRQLDNLTMSQGEDPDVFLSNIYQIKDELNNMNESVSDERLTDIIIEGLADDYSQIKYDAERDPDLSLSQIESTMRNSYVNRLARGKSARKPVGRESAMYASSPLDSYSNSTLSHNKCFNCGKPGHISRNCRYMKQRNGR
ncbi:unnamed protein product, partial [Sphacelaria rigidula]